MARAGSDLGSETPESRPRQAVGFAESIHSVHERSRRIAGAVVRRSVPGTLRSANDRGLSLSYAGRSVTEAHPVLPKTFCVLPFSQLTVANDGKAKLCTHTHAVEMISEGRSLSLNSTPLGEIWNSSYLR